MKREGVVSGAEKLALLEELGMGPHGMAALPFPEVVFGFVQFEALMMQWFDERIAFAEELLGDRFEVLTRGFAAGIVAACEGVGCEDRLVGYLMLNMECVKEGKSLPGGENLVKRAALDAGLARLFVFGDPPGEGDEGEEVLPRSREGGEEEGGDVKHG